MQHALVDDNDKYGSLRKIISGPVYVYEFGYGQRTPKLLHSSAKRNFIMDKERYTKMIKRRGKWKEYDLARVEIELIMAIRRIGLVCLVM